MNNNELLLEFNRFIDLLDNVFQVIKENLEEYLEIMRNDFGSNIINIYYSEQSFFVPNNIFIMERPTENEEMEEDIYELELRIHNIFFHCNDYFQMINIDMQDSMSNINTENFYNNSDRTTEISMIENNNDYIIEIIDIEKNQKKKKRFSRFFKRLRKLFCCCCSRHD